MSDKVESASSENTKNCNRWQEWTTEPDYREFSPRTKIRTCDGYGPDLEKTAFGMSVHVSVVNTRDYHVVVKDCGDCPQLNNCIGEYLEKKFTA